MSVSSFDRSLISILVVLISAAATSFSQTPSPTPVEGPEFIVPARPTVSNPAEFQRPGILQLEIGYDANFRARDSYHYQQDVPMALRFAVSRRLHLDPKSV